MKDTHNNNNKTDISDDRCRSVLPMYWYITCSKSFVKIRADMGFWNSLLDIFAPGSFRFVWALGRKWKHVFNWTGGEFADMFFVRYIKCIRREVPSRVCGLLIERLCMPRNNHASAAYKFHFGAFLYRSYCTARAPYDRVWHRMRRLFRAIKSWAKKNDK